MKYFLPAIFLALSLGSFLGLSKTQSFLSDEEKVSNNVLSVATAFVTGTPTPTVEPTPTVTPTPTPINPGDVVINEVYYDVASDKGDEGDQPNPDEWVELYNNTDSPINLKDWTISDNSDTRAISHSNVYIPANGFALLAKSASTWSYWTIPTSTEKISLGQKIGNALANTGDRLILRNESEIIIDQMNYGTDTFVWNPAAQDVAEGHSLERDPDGIDTDTAGDFVDRTVPTPGS